MEFQPYIENKKESFRKCNCGKDHDIKIIHGRFHYSEENHVGIVVALIEHEEDRHVWVSFITGEWPRTNHDDCYVTAHIWANPEGRVMEIKDSSSSPFFENEVYECYPVTREQVLAQEGAKEWFINTYLLLFEIDEEIGGYIEKNT